MPSSSLSLVFEARGPRVRPPTVALVPRQATNHAGKAQKTSAQPTSSALQLVISCRLLRVGGTSDPELNCVKVTSGDPVDPDVQMNNGPLDFEVTDLAAAGDSTSDHRIGSARHLMMQTTLFIGPVDFYYTDRVLTHAKNLLTDILKMPVPDQGHGKVQRKEMNTGDSCLPAPFGAEGRCILMRCKNM